MTPFVGYNVLWKVVNGSFSVAGSPVILYDDWSLPHDWYVRTSGDDVDIAVTIGGVWTTVFDSAGNGAGRLVKELRAYTRPGLLVIDEVGYLPIDKHGADLLFQIISGRYERGSIVLTTNKVYKQWPSIFNNDSTLTSAILDRVLHHAETVVIEGRSYRMKDRIEP